MAFNKSIHIPVNGSNTDNATGIHMDEDTKRFIDKIRKEGGKIHQTYLPSNLPVPDDWLPNSPAVFFTKQDLQSRDIDPKCMGVLCVFSPHASATDIITDIIGAKIQCDPDNDEYVIAVKVIGKALMECREPFPFAGGPKPTFITLLLKFMPSKDAPTAAPIVDGVGGIDGLLKKNNLVLEKLPIHSICEVTPEEIDENLNHVIYDELVDSGSAFFEYGIASAMLSAHLYSNPGSLEPMEQHLAAIRQRLAKMDEENAERAGE